MTFHSALSVPDNLHNKIVPLLKIVKLICASYIIELQRNKNEFIQKPEKFVSVLSQTDFKRNISMLRAG